MLVPYCINITINSKAMDAQDVYKLQNQLHSSLSRSRELNLENDELRRENARLKQRLGELQAIANNQPISLIREQLDPLALSNSMHKLENKVTAQAYQISFLKQLAEDKSLMLAQAQTVKNQLEVALEEKDLELSRLQHKIKEGSLLEDKSRKEVEMWKNKLEKANQERLKLIGEKEDLHKQLKREQKKTRRDLSELGMEIVQIQESAGKEHGRVSPKNILEDIVALQQSELHERNQEITKLKAINGNYSESSEVSTLKNTIKHLRGEITRYSSIIRVVTERLALAETAVKRYSESAEKCAQERAAYVARMQKLQTVRQLEESVQGKNEELQREKKARMDLNKNLVEVLYENQSLHEFLNETYGPNYQELLKRQVKHYSDRCNLKTTNCKWSSVDQLIRVNEKLRSKLRLS